MRANLRNVVRTSKQNSLPPQDDDLIKPASPGRSDEPLSVPFCQGGRTEIAGSHISVANYGKWAPKTDPEGTPLTIHSAPQDVNLPDIVRANEYIIQIERKHIRFMKLNGV